MHPEKRDGDTARHEIAATPSNNPTSSGVNPPVPNDAPNLAKRSLGISLCSLLLVFISSSLFLYACAAAFFIGIMGLIEAATQHGPGAAYSLAAILLSLAFIYGLFAMKFKMADSLEELLDPKEMGAISDINFV